MLDPFAGCATTLVAAEKLGFDWIGIDIWSKACDLVIRRLEDEGLLGGVKLGDIFFEANFPDRSDDGSTAAQPLPTIEKRVLPLEPWQKLSRKQIVQELTEAQSVNDGLVICAGCGREMEAPFMELDHITPRADRGVNDISNRILLCRPCNGRKSAKLTMKGLLGENRKAGWLKDKGLAIRARELAEVRYEDVRYRRNWPKGQETPDMFD